MPTALQTRVLKGLEAGRKLHELLQEVHMPSKAMVDEWCTSPEFSDLYDEAVEAGRLVRERAGSREEPAVRHVPAVLRSQFKERLPAVVPSEPTVMTPAERAAVVGQILAVTVGEELPAATVQPKPIPNAAAALQLLVLEKLRAGMPSKEVISSTKGFNQVKLSAWRKNPEFAAAWDEAKRAGKPTSAPPTKPGEIKHVHATEPLVVIQAQVLQLLREGTNYRQILAERLVKGFHTNALNKWRKDPAFKLQWDEALAAGRTIRGTAHLVRTPSIIPPAPLAETSSNPEAINGPAHYNGTEVYDQMVLLFGKEAVAAFCRLNAYKYRMRAGKKPGNSIEQDISKALWYESRLQQLA